jgi:fructosamine-3-kinase
VLLVQATVLEAIEGALEGRVVTRQVLGGGDTSAAYRLDLDDGRRVFAKTHLSPPPGFFTTEAAGLAWMAAADAVRVPAVLSVADDPPHLVLEWIDEGAANATTEAELGRSLAAMHRAGAPSFGREDRRTTGSLALSNDPADSWVEFFRDRRLLALAAIAEQRRALDERTLVRLRRVAARLAELAGPAEPPARLHGDLWAGNRLVDVAGRSWLIDPACVGGHREFDLAMMRLFGGFGPEVEAAYDEVHPRAEGWEERVELWQLAPLVVHAIKFGGGYVRATSEAVQRYA